MAGPHPFQVTDKVQAPLALPAISHELKEPLSKQGSKCPETLLHVTESGKGRERDQVSVLAELAVFSG